jgi:hypothetical protein
MITKQQELQMDISNYKSKVRKAIISNPGIVETYLSRIKELETQLARLKDNTPKVNNTLVTPKPKRFHYDPQGHYYEIWIDGELFLECTSCSADGPGNCSCWSC